MSLILNLILTFQVTSWTANNDQNIEENVLANISVLILKLMTGQNFKCSNCKVVDC